MIDDSYGFDVYFEEFSGDRYKRVNLDLTLTSSSNFA